jgi:hypothetical protein
MNTITQQNAASAEELSAVMSIFKVKSHNGDDEALKEHKASRMKSPQLSAPSRVYFDQVGTEN